MSQTINIPVTIRFPRVSTELEQAMQGQRAQLVVVQYEEPVYMGLVILAGGQLRTLSTDFMMFTPPQQTQQPTTPTPKEPAADGTDIDSRPT